MKRVLAAVALAATFAFGGAASAATIVLDGQTDIRLTLNDVSDLALSFSLDDAAASSMQSGGYVMWSSREDGLKDGAGPWGTCLNCGYDGGEWKLSRWENKTSTDLKLDFGKTLKTVYVWIRETDGGKVSVSYEDGSAGAPDIAPVPLPAGGLLLVSALGAALLLRKRGRKAA
ncbi:VPLPA-CTERM sorting domain-containing protein [Rhodovulum sulfidophilum]|uniref:VPLPA-CTERM sorting domain-containing protein n=1 Tax=Rhodovulum sulfidophilum TaxID=35806 RepID=UPI001923234B|nr:VPLPA-CTERM sorting domain-containing protein [Rhodovulum sulfidophilum]MBL3560505.1 VPLPA-CTERM sorting domain-containing protein [Rhodovulum sulfidophilum]